MLLKLETGETQLSSTSVSERRLNSSSDSLLKGFGMLAEAETYIASHYLPIDELIEGESGREDPLVLQFQRRLFIEV
ncbi:MAG: hypothetical protein GY696_02055 [Gammaproteobacteria bacterium]|nr:hypothetical protein [Gammaproteobacteria bacterium]